MNNILPFKQKSVKQKPTIPTYDKSSILYALKFELWQPDVEQPPLFNRLFDILCEEDYFWNEQGLLEPKDTELAQLNNTILKFFRVSFEQGITAKLDYLAQKIKTLSQGSVPGKDMKLFKTQLELNRTINYRVLNC